MKLTLSFLTALLWCGTMLAGNVRPEKVDSLKTLAEKAYNSGNYLVAEITTKDIANYYHVYNMTKLEAAELTFLGEIERANMNFANAIGHLDRAKKLAEQERDWKLLIRVHNRKAAVYYEAINFNESLKESELALELAKQYGIDDYTVSTLNIKATLFRDNGKLDEALAAYHEALPLAVAANNGDEEITICYNLAICYNRSGKLDSALDYSQRGLEIAYAQKRLSRIPYGYQLTESTYNIMGDSVMVERYHQRVDAVSDSIEIINSKEQKEFVEAAYMAPQTMEENQQLKKLNRENTIILIVLLVFLVVLAVGAVYVFRRNKLLRELNVQLTQQRKDIGQKNEELESLNKVKDKLFSVIAHDMRNPISSLTLALSMINEGDLTAEEQSQLMENLEKNATQVQEMLDNLLRWSRIQLKGETLIPAEFEMDKIVRETMELLQPMLNKKRISVSFDHSQMPGHVYADIEMIRFVVRNLLTNAIKFTHEGGKIDVQIATDKKFVTVSIADNGIGIPPEKISKLFTISGETTYGTKNERGTGLGLAIFSDFLAKNRGSIDVKSEEGKGSTFVFELPRVD